MIGSTQDHLPIQDIQNDLIMLKNGGVAMVMQTSAVNFDLLSEREQLAIIDGFAAMLNSLSFPIEIVIRSKRLNISNYLELLSQAEKKQTNPLLKNMMLHYRSFVAALIRENEVLDKKFYVVIPVSYLELGVISDSKRHFQKAATILFPRKDHIIKLMARMGLKAVPLDTERLVKLFYDYYNENPEEMVATQQEQPNAESLAKQTKSQDPQTTNQQPFVPQPVVPTPSTPQPTMLQQASTPASPPISPPPVITHPLNTPSQQKSTQYVQPRVVPTYVAPQQSKQPTFMPQKNSSERRMPFVVEELPDDYGAM